MKFELDDYHRNISTDELINDLRRVSCEIGKSTVTKEEYNRFGKYSSTTFLRRFGSWFICLEEAGLDMTRSPINISEEEMINDLKRVANEIRKSTVTLVEYDQYGQFDSTTLTRRFGSWIVCLERANLDTTRTNSYIPDKELYLNILELWTRLGRQPKYHEVWAPLSRFSISTYRYRFGSWRNALLSFVNYMNCDQSDDIEDRVTTSLEFENNDKNNNKFIHKTKRNINWRLRFLVLRRDNFKCSICGSSPARNPETELHVDHIVAWTEGGETVIENLQTLCMVCNIGKSNLSM